MNDQPAATAVAVFVPSGRRGAVRTGTTVLDAARELGVDLDSVCGGRGICGRCLVEPAFGAFAKHAITSSPDHLSPPARRSGTTTAAGRSIAGARLGLRGPHPRRRRDRRPGREPGAPAGRPQDRGPDDLVVDPVVRLYYVEVDPAALGEDRSDLRLLLDALAEQWALDGLAVDAGGARRPPARAGRRRARRHGRRARRPRPDRGLAGVRRRRLRRRGRRRVDDHRRPPVRPRHRRGARDGRDDEPADPLRRGPDEPRLVRDDERGGRGSS